MGIQICSRGAEVCPRFVEVPIVFISFSFFNLEIFYNVTALMHYIPTQRRMWSFSLLTVSLKIDGYSVE